MHFPFEYAAVQDVPVTLTIDPRRFTRAPPKRTLRSPNTIVSFLILTVSLATMTNWRGEF
jgi:hypothetical protein